MNRWWLSRKEPWILMLEEKAGLLARLSVAKINWRTDLMRFGWLDLRSLMCIRSSWPVAILTYYRHADKVVIHDSGSRGALPGLFCRSMELRPANVNFLDDTSFRFSRGFIFLLPNFPQERSDRARGELRRTLFPLGIFSLNDRPAYLVLRSILELIYIKSKIRSIR